MQAKTTYEARKKKQHLSQFNGNNKNEIANTAVF